MTDGKLISLNENSATEEFQGKMAEAATKGLTYQNVLEDKNAALIREGEELMAKKAAEAVQTKSLLQKARERLTGWIKAKR